MFIGFEMKKVFLILFLFISSAFAEVVNAYPSQEIIDSKIKIIDIRTPGEWKETGLLKGAIPITFFNEKGEYNIPVFLAELSKNVGDKEPVALICHVGNRSAMLADFLADYKQIKVINLLGGMDYAQKKGLNILPFKER